MRLFTAIELPPVVLAEVARTQAALRAAGLRARWAAPERAHLTVHFLGERPAEELPAIEAALRAACARVAPVAVALAGLGKFRSGVLWMGVAGDLAPLEAACARGLGLDPKPYRPHVTLARGFHGPLPPLAVDGDGHNFDVSFLTLYRSDLLPSGAVHHVLARIPLGQPSG